MCALVTAECLPYGCCAMYHTSRQHPVRGANMYCPNCRQTGTCRTCPRCHTPTKPR